MPAAPETAVHVHSIQEEYFYLMVHRCACGGPWLRDSQEVAECAPGLCDEVKAQCFKCKTRRTFNFVLDTPVAAKGPVREINPTAEPSRALDVAEWMDLAQFYLGRIERLSKPVEKAQSLLDSRQCIEEARKLYPAGADAPPPVALWSDESRRKASRRPDLYRRGSIAAMLERIPPTQRLRKADAMEQREFEKGVKDLAKKRVGRKWWQFWRLLRGK